ncbi:MAG: hypothetical protein J6A89_04055 [Clostridia bacterium]|nr:hypothetical protein [Clostridia bacterium]
MKKEELVDLLKSYKENIAKLKLRKLEKKKLERKLKQYKRLESNTTGSIGINCDIHSKNKISNKTEKTVIDMIELNEKEKEEAEESIKKLTTQIEELEEKVAQASIRLSALKSKEKEILYAYYVEEQTYEYIGNKLYFRLYNQTRDVGTIKKIVEKATNKMINL